MQTDKNLNLINGITRHDIVNQLNILTGFFGLSGRKTADPILLLFIKEEKTAGIIHEQIEVAKNNEDTGTLGPQRRD